MCGIVGVFNLDKKPFTRNNLVKMANAIASKDVRVNWKEITQSSHNVKEGDLIAMRGKGRVEVGEVSITKKQRYRVNLVRYK